MSLTKYSNILLLTILVIAFIVRIWNISTNPPELFSDELVNYTSARSMVERGFDLAGVRGWYFTNVVEARPPVYGYLSYVSTRLLGNNTLAIRLPAVLMGVATIYLVFELARILFQSTPLALWSAAGLTLMPWHIHYSRVGWEPAALLLPFLGWIYFTLRYCKNQNFNYLLVAVGLGGITLYTYQSAPLMVLVFTGLLMWTQWTRLTKKLRHTMMAFVLAVIVALPWLNNMMSNPQLTGRAMRIFTFANGVSSENLKVFLHNYLANLSPNFLVLKGDPNLRHGAGTGVVGSAVYIFAIAGLAEVLRKYSFQVKGLLLGWLVLYPLPAALTNDGVPHATRSLLGAPVMAILAGLGIIKITRWLSQRLKIQSRVVNLITLGVLVLASWPFGRIYYTDYPTLSHEWWEYGNREVLMIIDKLRQTNKISKMCLLNLTYWNETPMIDYYVSKNQTAINIDSIGECLVAPSVIVLDREIPEGPTIKVGHIVRDLNNNPLWYVMINRY